MYSQYNQVRTVQKVVHPYKLAGRLWPLFSISTRRRCFYFVDADIILAPILVDPNILLSPIILDLLLSIVYIS